jgi:hypothetical protein
VLLERIGVALLCNVGRDQNVLDSDLIPRRFYDTLILAHRLSLTKLGQMRIIVMVSMAHCWIPKFLHEVFAMRAGRSDNIREIEAFLAMQRSC